jgi:hypothetical protein
MLCAKNLKVVRATLITILAAGGFMSAHAALDLTSEGNPGTGHAVVVYAAETISTGSDTAGRRYTELMATEGEFIVSATPGLGLGGADDDDSYFVRFDLVAPDGVAAKFVGLGGADLTRTGTAASEITAIDVKPDSVAYAVWRTDELSADNVWSLDLDGDHTAPPLYDAAKVQIGGSGAGYKVELQMRIYSDVTTALTGTGTPIFTAKKPIVAVDRTVAVTASAAMPEVADVAAGFKRFTGASTAERENGHLGNINVSVTVKHVFSSTVSWDIKSAATGLPVGAASTVMKGGEAVISGNFAVGTFTVGGRGATLKDANGKELERYTEGDNKGKYMNPGDAATATFSVAAAGTANDAGTKLESSQAFVVNVKDNDTAIPVGSYSATTSATSVNDNASAIAKVEDQDVGSIERNGTTVHIGYLTTFAGHNQRLVMVNRGPLNVAYELGEITTEDGTVVTAKPMATGEIMPMSAKVIQVRDLLEFESGTTRAAATLTLTARPADITVSTTLVNTMDRSTDTVTHAAMGQ